MEFEKIDCFINKIKSEWKLPGIGVGIVSEKEVVYKKGFGYGSIKEKSIVTPNTLFYIGSITKSFNSTGIAILKEKGLLQWKDPVKRYIPEFPFSNLTIKDLLSHQTGLPFYTENLLFTRTINTKEELLEILGKLDVNLLTENYSYSNFMYVVLGYIIERTTGISWEEFTRKEVLSPLKMKDTFFSFSGIKKTQNISASYLIEDGILNKYPEELMNEYMFMNPAGGIISTVEDQCKWILFNLGATGNIIKKETLISLQKPVAVVRVSSGKDISYEAYCPGWKFLIYRNEPVLRHGGHVKGYSSEIVILPRRNFGAIILTNLGGSPAGQIIGMYLIDLLLGREIVNWNKRFKEWKKKKDAEEKIKFGNRNKKMVKGITPLCDKKAFTGIYSNNIYGDIMISYKGNVLKIRIKRDWFNLQHLGQNLFEFYDKRKRRLEVEFCTDSNNKIIGLNLWFDLEMPVVNFKKGG